MWLLQYYWKDLAEVQDFATKWVWSYNHDQLNMALGGFRPKQRLAMAAYRFYFWLPCKKGGLLDDLEKQFTKYFLTAN